MTDFYIDFKIDRNKSIKITALAAIMPAFLGRMLFPGEPFFLSTRLVFPREPFFSSTRFVAV